MRIRHLLFLLLLPCMVWAQPATPLSSIYNAYLSTCCAHPNAKPETLPAI